MFLSAGSGIAYEILAATTLTDLLGSSVYYFSLVIGVYLAALGIGGWLSSRISKALFERLILIELVLAALGGGLAFLIIGSGTVIFDQFDVKLLPIGPQGAGILFVGFSLFLVFMTGALVGLELPLFSRALAGLEDLQGALGKAFFWDYFGGLVVAVSLPTYFLPRFGLLQTTFLMGLLNAAAAVILILALGTRRRVHAAMKAGLAAVIALNMAGVLTAHRWELFFEQEWCEEGETVSVLRRSPYQKIVLTQTSGGLTRLYLNGQQQFESGVPERLYHEGLVHPAMTMAGGRRNILVLGGGDGLALREILKYPEVQHVTLVDIDRQMIDLSSRFPVMQALNRASFMDPRVHVAIEDAFMFVKHAAGRAQYDVIIIDFPDPIDDTVARLYSREFYRLVRRILDPDGIMAIQSMFFLTFPHRTIFTTVKAAGFSSVAAYRPRETVNAVTIAGMRSDLVSALDQLEVRVPSSSMRSRRDISRVIAYGRIRPYEWVGMQPNSIFRPTILRNPDHASLWRHYVAPHLFRWLRRRPETTSPVRPHRALQA